MANSIERPPWLDAMDLEDLRFLQRFLLCSGSLKALAEEYGVSYPTVRARLDRLIAKVREADEIKQGDAFERRLRLLIADGRLEPKLAKELLDAHRETLSPEPSRAPGGKGGS